MTILCIDFVSLAGRYRASDSSYREGPGHPDSSHPVITSQMMRSDPEEMKEEEMMSSDAEEMMEQEEWEKEKTKEMKE